MAQRQGSNPLVGIFILLFIAMMIWMAVTAVRGIFMILSWLALPLFILALIMNYSVVTDYGKWLWKMLKEDTVKGLLYTGLSIVGYPVVSAYLAFKAFANNRWTAGKKNKKSKGEYISYHEVEVEEEDDFLELGEIEEIQEEARPQSNKYDDLF